MNYVENIINALTTSTDNLLIVAEAGSGKTTVLIEIAKWLPKDKLSVALAFGTDIAAELGRRMPFWIQTSTSHTYGKRALERHLGVFKLAVAPQKTRLIAKEIEPNLFPYWSLTGPLVSLMKNLGVGIFPNTASMAREIVDAYELDCEGNEETAIDLAYEVFDQSVENISKSIDFDDMLYLPLARNAAFDPCDYVLVDEAQDLNPVQHELIRRMLKPDIGRLIAVGDPRQAIFGFRGADHLSMEHLAEHFACRVLPLSRTYRCSTAVVDEANTQWNKWNLPDSLSSYSLSKPL